MRQKSQNHSTNLTNKNNIFNIKYNTFLLVISLLIISVDSLQLQNIQSPKNSLDLHPYQTSSQPLLKINNNNLNNSTSNSTCITFQSLLNNPSLTVTLQSGEADIQNTKIIPIMKQSSCQLIVFVFHYGKFNITIQNIDQEIKNVAISFRALGISKSVCPYEGIIQTDIPVDTDQSQRLEVTQYITIQGYDIDNNKQFQQVRKVYLIRCSNEEWSYVTLPQRAIILTQLLAFICIIILTKNIKYRRFTPLNFGFAFALLYSFIILVIVYIDDIVLWISPSSNVQNLQIPKYIVAFFSLILITIYSMDILNFFLQKKLIIFGIAFFVSLVLIILDQIVLEDYWYINNIIAILISGCIIKFIVIRKIKASLLPLTILWLFSIARQFIHVQSVVQQLSLQIFPLHLQIPACFGDDPDGYSCSAFGSSKIIIMGLVINYAVRVDLFISSRFYQVLTLTVAFISLVIELLLNYILDEIPVMEYLSIAIFLPLSISMMILFANKRGQWAIIWHGSFYDMAVNRTSIRKSDKDSISRIQQTFGSGLLLSSNSSYTEESLIQK